ncbi:MAG: glycosyltransferase family 1 protein [Treponema sp.]|jgi:hypothetical protein|nr:glycosyltransferase family 1 protein [Treponema sp.]
MRIALVHYHLHPGGLTSVVYHQAQALIDQGESVLILTRDEQPPEQPLPVFYVKELHYEGPSAPVLLARALLKAMNVYWGQAADILHVHNPQVQTHEALIPALHILKSQNIRLLLQIYDLTQDFRPDRYVPDSYPENCHYGLITSQDYSYLYRFGMKPEGLHLIPHEVASISSTPGMERKRYLYPVRAVRRKNIGEALLLSLFIPKGRTIAITLPPVDNLNQWIYRYWRNFAASLKLPVEFDVGLDTPLSDSFGSSFCTITTSIKGSLGFSFLEPWTAGRAVIGRRINICRDFEKAGIRFDALYDAIHIPRVYIASSVLLKKCTQAIQHMYASFSLKEPPYIKQMITDELFSQETFDFGRFNEELQEALIRTLVSNDVACQDVAEINPFLTSMANWQPDEALIEQNRGIILDQYGKERIGKSLQDMYDMVLYTPVIHRNSPLKLLDMYFDPLRFSLLEVDHTW